MNERIEQMERIAGTLNDLANGKTMSVADRTNTILSTLSAMCIVLAEILEKLEDA